MTALASAAFRLALRGLAVFPLAPGTKVPLSGTHGHLDGVADADVARARWAKTPNANIGVATGARSGIWVLDIDPQHGGSAALADLEAKHGSLPTRIEASTPSGGRHLYWRWNAEGEEIRNSAGRIGSGIDVRGKSCFIVAPPSVLDDGRRYRWIPNGASTLADAPSWLVNFSLPGGHNFLLNTWDELLPCGEQCNDR